MFADNGERVYFNNIAVTGLEVLSVTTPERDVTFKVYPNPADNYVRVEASNSIDEITVYSIYGQSLNKYTPNTSNYQVGLENLPSGIYLLKVSSNNTEKTIKIHQLAQGLQCNAVVVAR